MIMAKIKITLEIDESCLDGYIDCQKKLNSLMKSGIKGTAKILNELMRERREVLGFDVLVAMERATGKQIPCDEF